MRTPLERGFFDRDVTDVARTLLGCVLWRADEAGVVGVRITEVEAYAGTEDPASHSYRGKTPRNEVMWGEPGHAYVYFTYGMHFCVNLVCGPEGVASAVLLRAGEVVAGSDVALTRRPGSSRRDLARGPARLCKAMAIDRALNGADVCSPGDLVITPGDAPHPNTVSEGPRVGVSSAHDVPWRFWLTNDPTVSAYRRHTPRPRTR
ncbi:DNA-3-methyladenine glycosylase [Actinocorallia sp. API 0066]|uniref:DNA-3-methyladenine glycosylase n=1 Tax=Actinocorallia sp. API 0066 TaxID=2896846 RepID=UPI001E5DEA94|nr:DNA-3-methyladenine glycosylase [Actinocorallia sp. API 0066]MCD0450694.1 DNA-3-methyladenine glycosylase [Actinocorallia sp. API 0066]